MEIYYIQYTAKVQNQEWVEFSLNYNLSRKWGAVSRGKSVTF